EGLSRRCALERLGRRSRPRWGRRNYTVLTLEMLARTYPEAELYMAMGSDMLLSFDSWHRWQEFCGWPVWWSRAGIGDAPELHAKAKQMDPTGAASCLHRSRLCHGQQQPARPPCSRGSV
ncbi:hypothetical protein ACKVMQ_13285, partial [Faecalibacterium hattorii]